LIGDKMNLFQIFLLFIGIALIFISRLLYSYKKVTKGFLITLMLTSFVIIFVSLFPELTIFLSRLLGVGRGSDAVVYLAIIFLLFALVKTNLKITELERKLSLLVQNLALNNYEKPKKKDKK